jgi:hypothetical protein
MNSRATILGALMCLTSAGGCGGLVFDNQYIDNSMLRSGGAEIYAYVPPPEVRAADMSPPLLTPRDDTLPAIIIRDEDGVDALASTTTVGSSRDRMVYASDVRNEVVALKRELARIEARANQKGGAGRAAIDPVVRDFDMANDALLEHLDRIERAPVNDWERLGVDANLALDDAREAVRQANEDVSAVRAPEL